MASEAELGNLIIKISTDISDIKKGLDKAKSDVNGFQKSVTSAFKLIVSAIAVHEIVDFGKRIVELGDQLNDLSRKTGMAASDIAGLRFAASQSNTSIEAIAGSMRILAKNMDDAARGNEKAREIFERFHIEYKNGDGTLRNYKDVMFEIADRMKNTTDKTTALAAAQQILGKNAQETFNFFSQGSEKIKTLSDRYFELGASRKEIDEFAQSANEFKDQWDEISKIMEILGIKIMSKLLPVFQDFAKTLLEKDWGKFADFIDTLLKSIMDTADQVARLVGWFQTMSGLVSGQTFGEAYGVAGQGPGGDTILQGEDIDKIARNRQQIIDTVYGGKDPGPGTTTSEAGEAQSPVAGASGGSTQGIDPAAQIEKTQNAMKKLMEEWGNVSKQITDSLAKTLSAITSGFGSAMADVIVDGKDFGEAMSQLWKDIAKQVIAEIVRMVAQLVILFIWQTITGTVGQGSPTGGGKKGIFGFDKGGVIGARNGLISGDMGFVKTGHMGEGGMPAIVHPNEIISPIDKFFDAVKDAGGKTYNITINGDADPQRLAQAIAVETERSSRSV